MPIVGAVGILIFILTEHSVGKLNIQTSGIRKTRLRSGRPTNFTLAELKCLTSELFFKLVPRVAKVACKSCPLGFRWPQAIARAVGGFSVKLGEVGVVMVEV